jgi:uncharacterized protein
MTIWEQIDQDLMQAQKEKKADAVSILRLLSSALKYERIKKRAELTDEDTIKILKSEIKKRHEAISDYDRGGRQDLVAKETGEIEFIEKYLPAQMSEEDVRAKVQAVLDTIEDKSNLGKVMGKVMAELKGQADGVLVKKIVEELQK